MLILPNINEKRKLGMQGQRDSLQYRK